MSSTPPPTFNAEALKLLLDTINPAGSFATSGSFMPSALCPKIVIENVGLVGLPVHPLVAEAIKQVAEKAPYGRFEETLVDETVRQTWQLDPIKKPNVVTVAEGDDHSWSKIVSGLVEKASYELGISNENVKELGIEAHLYKVLLYEKGGHFKPHKDTVKEPGMFGTFVIQLPSKFSGGASIVKHQGQIKRFEVEKDCDSSFQYTAFYADCEHEILPVTEGWRLCLVYNLVVTKPSKAGLVPSSNLTHATVKELQAECAKWLATGTGKLGYPLDHLYTMHSSDFGSLKGRDAVVMSALRHAVDDTGARLFDLAMAIFFYKDYCGDYDSNKEKGIERWILEDGTNFSFDRYYYSKEEKERRELLKKSPVWCDDLMHLTKDGFLKDAADMEDEELEDDESDGPPDHFGYDHEEQHCAGNEGGGSTTWYRSACIILRPASGLSLASTVASLCADSVAHKNEGDSKTKEDKCADAEEPKTKKLKEEHA